MHSHLVACHVVEEALDHLHYMRKDAAQAVRKAVLSAVANLGNIEDNRTRLIKFQFDSVKVSAIKVTMTATYGSENVKLFEVRAYS